MNKATDLINLYKSFKKEPMGSPDRRSKALAVASLGDSMAAELFQAKDEIGEIGRKIKGLELGLKSLGFVLRDNAWENDSINNALALDPAIAEAREAAHRADMIQRGFVWSESQKGWIESEELKRKNLQRYETAFIQARQNMDRV